MRSSGASCPLSRRILGTSNALASLMYRELPTDRTRVGPLPQEECDIIAALRAGDSEIWGEVYRTHRKAAHSAANRIIRDSSVAEDLAQETFLILPEALQGFRGDCTLRTFIVSITHNLARHHLRAHFRRHRAIVGYSQVPRIRVAPSPEQHLVRRQLGSEIGRALAKLSTERQTAFLLYEHLGHSASEIARLTRAPAATVRTRVHYARRGLREVLSNSGFASLT